MDIVVNDEGEATIIHSITYDNSDPNNKITSFTFLEDYLYLVLGPKKSVDIYYAYDDVPLVLTIN